MVRGAQLPLEFLGVVECAYATWRLVRRLWLVSQANFGWLAQPLS